MASQVPSGQQRAARGQRAEREGGDCPPGWVTTTAGSSPLRRSLAEAHVLQTSQRTRDQSRGAVSERAKDMLAWHWARPLEGT